MLFKYRSFRPFEYLVDIIAKERLYASKYSELNDPMEGQYLYENFGGAEENMKETLKNRKQKLRICSLSEKPDDTLMWSHYADGHSGVVVGVEVDDFKYDIRSITYDGPARVTQHRADPDIAKEILSHKLEAWEYEEEVRVFVDSKHYVEVDLELIVCGRSMSNQDKSIINDLVDGLCPHVDFITQPEKHDLRKYA
jgi:DNA-binding HxlR family transcriptional regulator